MPEMRRQRPRPDEPSLPTLFQEAEERIPLRIRERRPLSQQSTATPRRSGRSWPGPRASEVGLSGGPRAGAGKRQRVVG
jgi:hypothetical protein